MTKANGPARFVEGSRSIGTFGQRDELSVWRDDRPARREQPATSKEEGSEPVRAFALAYIWRRQAASGSGAAGTCKSDDWHSVQHLVGLAQRVDLNATPTGGRA
eukprot:CAMPEP_0181230674 /NCGR_PEP_ID=MMETSP1096-20121128/34621_1 /TAXON_ID=156174 ORGANISM="Chrysochromulina ericina, Strain CCMP281" /NCGR_SAMPLE_ID=MMETSP1096 /ASSEMBLY_ACC=CAM_ASM_000453 /LENGTH=103 /DNA_ID=CAMNT_0023324509 /DNA_START=150 /DNA_END=458 /DNA_ORIENTATION=+